MFAAAVYAVQRWPAQKQGGVYIIFRFEIQARKLSLPKEGQYPYCMRNTYFLIFTSSDLFLMFDVRSSSMPSSLASPTYKVLAANRRTTCSANPGA